MLRILYYSLEKIDAIKQFYDFFEEIVHKRVEEEKAKNLLGYEIDQYFRKRVSQKNKHEDIEYKELEERVLQEIDIFETEKNDQGKEKGFSFIYRDEERLRKCNIETNPLEAVRQYSRAIELSTYYSQTALVNLETRFEEFIAGFARYLFWKYPNVHLREKSITFSEIEGKNPEEVKAKFISKEVDELMHKNHTEWFKLFKSHKISFEMCCNEIAELNEIITRRHMIIHNAGRVNPHYIQAVKGTAYKDGDFLEISKEYLQNAINTMKIIMFIMMIEAVKLEKARAEKLTNDIFNVVFDELYYKQYEVAKAVFKALKDSKYADDDIKNMSRVNEWIASIELGEFDRIRGEIESFNTDGLADKYFLAKLILQRKYEGINTLLNQLLISGDLDVRAIEDWPLFIHYRTTPEYEALKETNKELFQKEQFTFDEIGEIEKEKESNIEMLVGSDSFLSTHKAIKQLSIYDEFNMDQINRMIDAALMNSQIRWIISDADVKEFYSGLVEKCNTDNSEKVKSLLKGPTYTNYDYL